MIANPTHCSWCGDKFQMAEEYWPKNCESCQNITYQNPKPIAVLLMPGMNEDGTWGVVVGRRSIEPKIGEFAFPGGFIENNETAEEAASREMFEEMGIMVDPSDIIISHTENTAHGHLLIFCETFNETLEAEEFAEFKPSDEVSEIGLATADDVLAFPLHTAALRKFFEG